ncbi:DUF5675 family protein [Parabacteroides goldsteinii]|uniref:DUF5675 family protein n=1 Tax=Parabacteroides goldsteinii TaxID=328812 RepID=UPI001D7D6234|nr:DUF5675 family protein [Parabacteroides goldsteinii]MBS6574787.1 hypothetical protein [Parabacteroides goldsteinii]
MKLTLKRKFLGDKYTIGDLFIDGKFFCNTIEDTVKELPPVCPNTPKGISCRCSGKVYAETAIPFGTYKVTMKYSPKFKRVLPYLHDVQHFLAILIHSGNSEADSAGCLICGKNTVKGKMTESKKTCDALNRILTSALSMNENVSIAIQ